MFCCNINSFYVITNQRLFIKEGQFNEKTVSLILAMIVMFSTVSSVTTFATDDGVYKDFKYTVNSDSSVTISGYTGNDSSVKIPDSIGGKSVESIGNSVTKIGKAARFLFPRVLHALKIQPLPRQVLKQLNFRTASKA